jgi:hypothetical protein
MALDGSALSIILKTKKIGTPFPVAPINAFPVKLSRLKMRSECTQDQFIWSRDQFYFLKII